MSSKLLQPALLLHLIALHPVRLTEDGLVRELSENPKNREERDAVEGAARELASAGLLHYDGPFVLPSKAALRSYELWQA